MPENQVTPEERAYATLLQDVHHPVFFQKLAEYGLVPETEEDAAEYLAIAAKLRYANSLETSKKASANVSEVKQASAELDQVINSYYGANIPSRTDNEVKQATKFALQNPALKQAAQVFGVAMSGQ